MLTFTLKISQPFHLVCQKIFVNLHLIGYPIYLYKRYDMNNRKYTVIDLFAGCGGLSLGLYQAGWSGVFAVEKNKCAFETLKHNLIDKKHHFNWPEWLPQEPTDIVELLKKHEDELKSLRGKIDLVAGGPPCQGFSMAGKRMENDERNKLVFSYISFIGLVQPRLLLFENVKGFTYSFDKEKNPNAIPYSRIVVDRLEELGYDIMPHILNFAEFGVPQRRKRFILVGVRKSLKVNSNEFLRKLKDQFPDFINQYGLTATPTLSDAISDLLKSNGTEPTPDRPGFQSGRYAKPLTPYQKFLRMDISESQDVPNSHSFARHTSEKTSCFEKLLSERSTIAGRRIDGDERKKWGIRQRGITVLDPNTVSPTITGAPDDYLHYSEPRIMTVRECARIQSFPDWYEFKSKYTTGGVMRKTEVPRYSQVGNAIPPLFAFQAGLILKSMI